MFCVGRVPLSSCLATMTIVTKKGKDALTNRLQTSLCLTYRFYSKERQIFFHHSASQRYRLNTRPWELHQKHGRMALIPSSWPLGPCIQVLNKIGLGAYGHMCGPDMVRGLFCCPTALYSLLTVRDHLGLQPGQELALFWNQAASAVSKVAMA